MTPGGSAGPRVAGEQIWLRSPWPLLLAICGVAALWTFLAGDPFEGLEMRWFGQILSWRYERGLAPPADPSPLELIPYTTMLLAAAARKIGSSWALVSRSFICHRSSFGK